MTLIASLRQWFHRHRLGKDLAFFEIRVMALDGLVRGYKMARIDPYFNSWEKIILEAIGLRRIGAQILVYEIQSVISALQDNSNISRLTKTRYLNEFESILEEARTLPEYGDGPLLEKKKSAT